MHPTAAHLEEALELVGLHDEAAAWLMSRGLRQWAPGDVSIATTQAQTQAGQWFVVREAKIVAALRVLSADPDVWGVVPDDSAYVHGLVVRNSHRGRGIGAELLAWAERYAAGFGRIFVRLDCVETNQRLRRYYQDHGYQLIGRKALSEPWSPVALFEKRVGVPRASPRNPEQP